MKDIQKLAEEKPKQFHDKWGKWECPVCGSIQTDPEEYYQTTCKKGHTVSLGPVLESGWRETFDETK